MRETMTSVGIENEIDPVRVPAIFRFVRELCCAVGAKRAYMECDLTGVFVTMCCNMST
jgi:hypothetical protein